MYKIRLKQYHSFPSPAAVPPVFFPDPYPDTINPALDSMGLTSTSHSGVRVFSGDEEGIHYFLPAGLFIQPPEASVEAAKISVASVETAVATIGGADPTHAMAKLALEVSQVVRFCVAKR